MHGQMANVELCIWIGFRCDDITINVSHIMLWLLNITFSINSHYQNTAVVYFFHDIHYLAISDMSNG